MEKGYLFGFVKVRRTWHANVPRIIVHETDIAVRLDQFTTRTFVSPSAGCVGRSFVR